MKKIGASPADQSFGRRLGRFASPDHKLGRRRRDLTAAITTAKRVIDSFDILLPEFFGLRTVFLSKSLRQTLVASVVHAEKLDYGKWNQECNLASGEVRATTRLVSHKQIPTIHSRGETGWL